MRLELLQRRLLPLPIIVAMAVIFLSGPDAYAQSGNPLVDDRPVRIERKTKPNRTPKKTVRRRPVVVRSPLLKLQWRVLKVKTDGTAEETSPLALFHVGDRLRLAVQPNQNGYLYIIHQLSPTQPGRIIFPDSRINSGRNDVAKSRELILPSNCPTGIAQRDCALIVVPPAGREVFTLLFTRDPITDLPNTAFEASGGIPVETLLKLKQGSGQVLRRIKGSTPMSVLVVNTNTKDNEDIFETLLLNKAQ